MKFRRLNPLGRPVSTWNGSALFPPTAWPGISTVDRLWNGLIQNANPANIKQLFGPENLPGRSINRLQERSVDIRTYARTYVCSLCMDSRYIFYKKKKIII